MNRIKKMAPYLLVCELAFLILALIGVDTGGLMLLLFIIIPIVCFVASLIYGCFNKFQPIQLLFPLFIGILFTLTFYIVSQEAIWIYITASVVISLAGNGVGYVVGKFVKYSR